MVPNEPMIPYVDDVYRTAAHQVSWFSRTFPSCNFYRKFAWNVYRSSVSARQGTYGDAEWSQTSFEVLRALESVGVGVEVRGVDHFRELDSPCVFVGNHMSMLETIVLPAVIQPIRDVTFVVKKSLMDYPVFRHIVRSRDPIAVTRESPRDDFKTVMSGGIERLQKGVSIVVFPQTTRSLNFDSSQFNTIGVKLALRAKVPVVPIALKTDAWGNGKWIKDLGPIDPRLTVRIAFGEPLTIQDRGSQAHQRVIEFIESNLSHWSEP